MERTKEHIQKILSNKNYIKSRKAMKGEGNPAKRPEVRKKIREALTGKKFTTTHCEKLSKARAGKTYEEFYGKKKGKEMKEKRTKQLTGKTNPFYGKHHSKKRKEKHSERMSGERHPFYGKERPEQSKKMKEGLSVYASSFIRNPSRPQVTLYKHLKKLYPEKEFGTDLNYPVSVRPDKHLSLDVGVPDLMVDFEYDGEYWHGSPEQNTRDLFRDEALMQKGWAIVRIRKKDLKNLLKQKGSGWHGDRIRHSNAKRFGRG